MLPLPRPLSLTGDGQATKQPATDTLAATPLIHFLQQNTLHTTLLIIPYGHYILHHCLSLTATPNHCAPRLGGELLLGTFGGVHFIEGKTHGARLRGEAERVLTGRLGVHVRTLTLDSSCCSF